VLIWRLFDWGIAAGRGRRAPENWRSTVVITETSGIKAQVKKLKARAELIAPEDQAINLCAPYQSHPRQRRNINSYSRPNDTNQFFMEQTQNINASQDEQLVDFL